MSRRRPPGPDMIAPMRATTSASVPADDERWAYELKWDGVRAVCFAGADGVRLQSRNLTDVTANYPELAGLAEPLGGREAVLDGEIVAFDAQGRPSFQRLQQRINVGGRGALTRTASRPVTYIAFDLLRLDGEDLMGLPYARRRELLDGLHLAGTHSQVPAYHVGDGEALLEATRRQGLEGLMAKRLDSPYTPGVRSRAWLKIKNVRRQEVVVAGWLPGEGARSGHFGALLVGHYSGGGLRYAGRVGSGFSEAELERLAPLLAELARPECPFHEPPPVPPLVRRRGRWLEPRLVAEVAFTEWTDAGTLRQPSYKGLRWDTDPERVVRELPTG